jgi:hypothetical protein
MPEGSACFSLDSGCFPSQVLGVMDSPHEGKFLFKSIHIGSRAIPASVIYDKDFKIVSSGRKFPCRRAHNCFDGVLVVIGWEKSSQRNPTHVN